MAGHGAAVTGSATDSLGSSPLVPASKKKKINIFFYECHKTAAGNMLLIFPVLV